MMMKIGLQRCAVMAGTMAGVLLGVSGVAYAGEAGRWYIGGALLKSSAAGSLHQTLIALPPRISVDPPLSYLASDTRSDGGRLYAGYRMNRYMSIEGGYTDLGRMSFSKDNNYYCPPTASCAALAPTVGDIRVSGWHVNARGALPVTDFLTLTGKLGVLASTTRLRAVEGLPLGLITAPVPTLTDRTSHRASPIAGLGVAYRLTPAVSATVEWERITRIGSRDTGEFTAKVVSFGVTVDF